MSGGHGASRRRNYGKRQKDVRERLPSDLSIDLDGPVRWPRGSSWDVSDASSSSRWGGVEPRGTQPSQPGSAP